LAVYPRAQMSYVYRHWQSFLPRRSHAKIA
jgi:hypothetical protein